MSAIKTGKTHKQYLKVTEQLELSTEKKGKRANPFSKDIDSEVAKAQKQIDELRLKQEALNKEAQELVEISEKKEEFIAGQIEVTEKFSTALTHMDREIFEMKQEIEDLEQTRKSFAKHVKTLEAIDVSRWGRAGIQQKLDKALSQLDQADEEFHLATEYFEGSRAAVFGGRKASRSTQSGIGGWIRENLVSNFPFLGILGLFLFYYILNR